MSTYTITRETMNTKPGQLKDNHRNCAIGDALPPDYFSPGFTMMHGQPAFSVWAEIPHEDKWLRFERAGLGEPWVRVLPWVEVRGMPWNPGGLYRYRGKRLCGWPDEVQFYCDQTRQWEDCPNINAHARIARAYKQALEQIAESHDSPDNDMLAADALERFPIDPNPHNP